MKPKSADPVTVLRLHIEPNKVLVTLGHHLCCNFKSPKNYQAYRRTEWCGVSKPFLKFNDPIFPIRKIASKQMTSRIPTL